MAELADAPVLGAGAGNGLGVRVASPAFFPMTPDDYIDALEEPRRGEIRELHDLIRESSPTSSRRRRGMIGYGPFHYRYASGREGDAR